MNTRKTLLLSFFLLVDVAVARAQFGRFDASYPNVHDPVMAKGEDGRYYLFSTGMGVGVISSADLKEWRREPSVFSLTFLPREEQDNAERQRRRPMEIDWGKSTLPRWGVDTIPGYRGHMWAPDISYHNGLWYLYYSCSTFGKNGSAIGLATNKTLDPASPDFKWQDQGVVIVSHKHRDNWNAIDPNLVLDEKGNPYLTFGSFWDGIQIVRLSRSDFKTPMGKPKTISRRIGRKLTLAELDKVENFTIEGNDTIEAGDNAVEAPFIIRRGKYFYLFVSFDYCCRGERSTYKTVYGRSKNVEGPYLDKEGRRMDKGGGTILFGPDSQFFGIGHCSVYPDSGNKYHFLSHAYDKNANGAAKIFLRTIRFGEDGWIERDDD